MKITILHAGITCVLVAMGSTAPPAGEAVLRWSFDAGSDREGWEAGSGIENLRAAGGRLTGRLVGADAYILAPAVRVPMDGLQVRVRWSCPSGGSGQCYFATDRSPAMGEDKVISRTLPGGAAVETEFPLDPAGRGEDVLTRLRLDPFNGAVGVEFEVDEVALIQLPPILEADFGPERSVARAREPVKFHVVLRHRGGRRPPGPLEAEVDHPAVSGRRVPLDGRASSPQPVCELAFEKTGVFSVRARLRAGQEVMSELESLVIIEEPSDLPRKFALEGRGMAVELLPGAAMPGDVLAARLWARSGGDWRDAGLLLPLVEVDSAEGEASPGSTGLAVRRRSPPLRVIESDGHRLRLGARGDGDDAWRPELILGIAPDTGGGVESLRSQLTLQGPRGGRLLRLSGPAVRRLPAGDDPLDRLGLFGGIEYLEPGWRSSSDRAVGPKHADRWTPHPLKVCLPAMAIEEGGVTTALLWDPLEEWAPGRRMPAATFASPNFLDGRPEHLLRLFVPSIPEISGENATLARRPFILDGGEVKLSMTIRAAADAPIVAAARWWYERFGIPEPPPAPHGEKATHDIIARSYGETVWWPEDRGWRHHWFLDRHSSFRPDMAAELLLHAKLTGERRWLEATGLDPGRSLIETAGTLWDRAAGSAAGARAAASAQRDDGTYPYHDSPAARDATRRHTGGRFDTLGDEGSTSLGTCVQAVLPLLHHVLLTGGEELTARAERALRAMRRFHVPRGAQVWEVHQQIPDIRAAALAVEAFRIGYLITGDASYLDDALRWADAGLPFLYSWRTPDPAVPAPVRTSRDRSGSSPVLPLAAPELFLEPRRQVTPYGTIPVLGTTYYVMSWFGVVVQWCGLEWAWKVLDLCDVRDDPLLRAVALGVIHSGLQQTFDREPWVGLYPDVWNIEESWAGGALICPHLTVQALRAAGRLPQDLRNWTRRAGAGPAAPLVHGWGAVTAFEASPAGITVSFRFAAGEPCEVLVARSARPASVLAGGRDLPEIEGSSGEKAGWRHDPERRLLGIRFTQAREDARVSIRFE